MNAQRATTGTKGHIWWYSSGVLDTDEAAMTAYYNVAANGQAPRPDQDASWRSAPRVATGNAGVWTATTLESNRYQIIARSGTTWSIWLNTVLPAGTLSFNVGGSYSAVELLIDRRGYTPGDTDFDGSTDFDDLLVLAQNYGLSGKMWAQGDFTLDGVVNFDDLLILAQYYDGTTALDGNSSIGKSIASDFALARSLVPEPTSVAVLCITTSLTRRRRS